MKAIDGQLPFVATTPPTIFTLLSKFTVPHAAWFCFILIELFIKFAHKNNKLNKINKLKELVAAVVVVKIKN